MRLACRTLSSFCTASGRPFFVGKRKHLSAAPRQYVANIFRYRRACHIPTMKVKLTAQIVRKLTRALLQPQFDFLEDFWIEGSIASLDSEGVGNPNRRDVDQDRHRSDRQRSLWSMQAINPPVRLEHRFRDGATRLLVEERHPVRETQKMDGLVPAGDQLFGAAPASRAASLCIWPLASTSISASPGRPNAIPTSTWKGLPR